VITEKMFYFEERVLKHCKIDYRGSRVLGIGDDVDFRHGLPAKNIYYARGVDEHVSFDINGKNGAVPLDLNMEIPNKYHNVFNIVTNYGTIEHVNNQYSVFKNIHDAATVGAVFIHGFPLMGNWPLHGRYYYCPCVLRDLCRRIGYKMVVTHVDHVFDPPKPDDKDVFAAWIKTSDRPFISEGEFANIKIYDSGQKDLTGNYDYKKG
tara:strand:+ start:136 stop:756 length:621 start_codon:yes stop_codon:yes gene_type:complete